MLSTGITGAGAGTNRGFVRSSKKACPPVVPPLNFSVTCSPISLEGPEICVGAKTSVSWTNCPPASMLIVDVSYWVEK